MKNSEITTTNIARSKERGAVLIVALVILTILTIIAVNTSTDIGLQTNMTRNTQISQATFNNALSELNAQNDQLSEDTVNQARTDGTVPIDAADHLIAAPNHTKLVAVEFLRSEGRQLGENIEKDFLVVEIHSSTQLGTGIGSSQSLGVYREAP